MEDGVEKFIIITEYCNLGDLSKVMKITQGKAEYMPLFVRIINGVLQGLSVLHSTKQIHRDLKPLNILVSGDLNDFKTVVAKLGDLGLGKFVDSSQVILVTRVAGTLNYISPEMMIENAGGMPSDMWALGVTFHQMLSENGGNPFETP